MSGEILFRQAEEQLRRMQVTEALRLYELAERAEYEADACAGARWICHMLLGNFEQAWNESNAIESRGKPDLHRFWDGQSFKGRKVLIRCLHGLGDTIQFIRYAPLIRQQARALTIEAQPALKRLIQEARLADQVITWGEMEPAWDQQMEVIELPRIFRTTKTSIPSGVPYLDVFSAPLIGPYDGRRSLRVGVVWASSAYNAARSMTLEQMAPLFKIPEVEFFSLQAGKEQADLQRCPARIENLLNESECVLGTATKLKTLDLIITVDTMMAHLAGAMARPVWTLLPFQCDWRWMIGREDSPWYPTMRLFRQRQPGDWDGVVKEARQALTALAARSYSEVLP